MKKSQQFNTPDTSEAGPGVQPGSDVGQDFSSVATSYMRRMAPMEVCNGEIILPAALFCHVFLLNSVLERVSNRCAETHELTMPQWMALGCIGNGGAEGITHSELGSRLMLSKAPITGVVDRLERDGYVQRASDPKDRRVSRVLMTPKGEDAWLRVRQSIRDCATEYCACLSEEEQRNVVTLLARLLDSAAQADPILGALRQDQNGDK